MTGARTPERAGPGSGRIVTARHSVPDSEGLTAFLRRVNAARRAGPRGTGLRELAVLEEVAETLFEPSGRLAAYGSLRPGKENHEVVGSLDGRWREGFVRGWLWEEGWGTDMGYPALRWEPDGKRIPVGLFESPDLPAHWSRIDAFEGADYVRILVPVRDETGIVAVANLYALSGEADPPGSR